MPFSNRRATQPAPMTPPPMAAAFLMVISFGFPLIDPHSVAPCATPLPRSTGERKSRPQSWHPSSPPGRGRGGERSEPEWGWFLETFIVELRRQRRALGEVQLLAHLFRPDH